MNRLSLSSKRAAAGALIAWASVCHCAIAAPSDTPRIDTPFFRFSVNPTNGACEIVDKKAGVTWRDPSAKPRLGWLKLNHHNISHQIDLRQCYFRRTGNELELAFVPFTTEPQTVFHVFARALPDQKTLELSYQEDDELEVESVSLLDRVLSTSAAEHGYALVPVREGLLVPADSGLAFTHRFDSYSYEGCHMAMLGVVRDGAAALLSWDDPYVAADLHSVLRATDATGSQRLLPSLVLSDTARSFRVQFLGKGDYVSVAKAYRTIAKQKGWWVGWDQKVKANPTRAKLFGAANIKLWSALDRRMNAESTKQEAVHVNWTFDEAAQVAEHFKRDLKLDKVLFTVGGWIHRGYDNQHPDILPTAPECGGDAAFSNCARRVQDLGYLFCLHDNYQDIYRDSPSWNEGLVMKNDEGKLVRGGRWAGGQAYLVCSQQGLMLAKRPQNLPGVKQLSHANAYFIDTTYAAGLQECYDPEHALTRSDDMRCKQELSDYARNLFGVFGSECGREWAIPHSDFFEGLTGVSGHAYHDAQLPKKLGASVVPLFDLVYRECIAMYGKYGYEPRHAAGYVLRHISLARPLNYHAIPPHLYWQQPFQAQPIDDPGALFCRADNGWAADCHPLDRFIKNTCEVLCPLNELTARLPMTTHQFLNPERTVERTVFGDGKEQVEVVINLSTNDYSCESKLGGKVALPPYGFVAEGPTFVAFHALNWAGMKYDKPSLFTLRSLDNKPLSRSRRVRVYHAFGDAQLKLGKALRTVQREEVIDSMSSRPNAPGTGS